MRIIQFDMMDVPPNATKYFYLIMNQAQGAGFYELRDIYMGFDVKIKTKRKDLMDQIIWAFENSGFVLGSTFWVYISESIVTISDTKKPTPNKGEWAEVVNV